MFTLKKNIWTPSSNIRNTLKIFMPNKFWTKIYKKKKIVTGNLRRRKKAKNHQFLSSQPLTTTTPVTSMSLATSIWSIAVSPLASASSSSPFLLHSLFFFYFSASLFFGISSFERLSLYLVLYARVPLPHEYWSH